MCFWESNKTHKDKGTTAAGQARLEGLCPPAPGGALVTKQETPDTHTQTHTQRTSVGKRREELESLASPCSSTDDSARGWTCSFASLRGTSEQ